MQIDEVQSSRLHASLQTLRNKQVHSTPLKNASLRMTALWGQMESGGGGEAESDVIGGPVPFFVAERGSKQPRCFPHDRFLQ
jgi:hypothetical protein